MEPNEKRVHEHSRKSPHTHDLRSWFPLFFHSYEERLRLLGLESLENRRKRGDIIQCFKTMNSHGNIDPNTWFDFVQDRHEKNTRNHSANSIVPEKCNTNVRKHFYTNRVSNEWNNLPPSVRNASSTNAFKNSYDDLYIYKLNSNS